MAERELTAFFHAVTQLFGPEQAKLSAEDWLRELTGIDRLPASIRDWRSISVKVAARLATSSISNELTNARECLIDHFGRKIPHDQERPRG